jgi:hypothetical protein
LKVAASAEGHQGFVRPDFISDEFGIWSHELETGVTRYLQSEIGIIIWHLGDLEVGHVIGSSGFQIVCWVRTNTTAVVGMTPAKYKSTVLVSWAANFHAENVHSTLVVIVGKV